MDSHCSCARHATSRCRLLHCFLLSVLLSQLAFGSDAMRPFTVADSIAYTQILDPDVEAAPHLSVPFNVSPDSKLLAVVTRKGNLDTGRNEYTLYLYSIGEIKRLLFLRSHGLPRPAVVASLVSTSYRHGIERVMWADGGRKVTFIGRDGADAGQVYIYDVIERRLRRLTSSALDIATYDIAWSQQRLVYSAYAAPDWTERNRRGYSVRSSLASELATEKAPRSAEVLSHFMMDLKNNKLTSLRLPNGVVPRDFALSQDGKSAVTLAQLYTLQPRWNEYQFLSAFAGAEAPVTLDATDAPASDINGDPFGRIGFWINQYHLVDLETGIGRPLIEAPAIVMKAARPIWTAGSHSVIVADTYLPFTLDSQENLARRNNLVIAEVDRSSLRVERIMDVPGRTPDDRSLLLDSIEMPADGELLVRLQSYDHQPFEYRYKKHAGTWTRIPETASATSSDSLGVEFSIVQDMNTPPRLLALDAATGRRLSLVDFNPQLRAVSLGTVEEFIWKDQLGRTFRGGLLYPPKIKPGDRYPLVLQTYGFSPKEFLLDGPGGMSTAYAARALASRGFVVAQLPELDGPGVNGWQRAKGIGENDRYVAALEGAVDELGRRDDIDSAKIGIVGFSREGMHVHYAATFSRIRFGAVVLSDCITATPFSYVLAYGFPKPGMLEWEEDGLVGAPFWGSGVDLWRDRSPAFHLDRIHAPLRLETIGFYVPSVWETFALLKRHKRPADLIHIPLDIHRLQTPWGRLASQEGTVDWFSFWLKGEVDDVPRKRDQYAYWRILERQYEVLTAQGKASALTQPHAE